MGTGHESYPWSKLFTAVECLSTVNELFRFFVTACYILATLCFDTFSGFIAIANELLEKCNLPDKISRLEECSDRFFVAVYKGLLGDDLPGKSK